MKTDTVFKRAFNDAIDLAAALEVGESLPSEHALSVRLGIASELVHQLRTADRCALGGSGHAFATGPPETGR